MPMSQTEAVADSIAKLNILSPNALAHKLGISVERLHDIAARADAFYRPFDATPRPRPFQKNPPRKPRHIDRPEGELKDVQRTINRVLLQPIVFPAHVCGAVPSRSILDNASRHLGASTLVTMDIRKCFPSITNKQIYRTWADALGCSARVAALLTRLTTFERHLPQGAPTSQSLANIFIWFIDGPIRVECARLGIAYSTWIDDLAFSGDRSREIIQFAIGVLASHKLAVSRGKIKVMGPRATKLLTGTRLGKDRLRVPNDLRSRVRSGLHKFELRLPLPCSVEDYLRSLGAQMKHIQRLCPDDVRSFANFSAFAAKSH
jgi:hypothetical protein